MTNRGRVERGRMPPSTMPRIVAIAAVVASMTACAWWMRGRADPTEPTEALSFSHPLHADNGIACESCHEGIATATDMAQSWLPSEEQCLECHEREENCGMCHTDAANPRGHAPHRATVGFSHVLHVDGQNVPCERCHRGAVEASDAPLTPVMDTCLDCHRHQREYASGRCTGCHLSLRDLPLTAVAEFEHGGDWLARHGTMARSDGATCLQCHPQTFCSDCHATLPGDDPVDLYPDEVTRPLIHRGDVATTHAIEARADPDTCLRCHRTQQCQRCHDLIGLTPSTPRTVVHHPVGYAQPGGGHARDARASVETCAGCHDDGPASVCIDCHRVGGLGGNPHPRGYAADHDRAEAGRRPPCIYCH